MDIVNKIAKIEDLEVLTNLACKLYGGDRDEIKSELTKLLNDSEAIFFLAYVNDECVGFAQCQLRYDYVEGCSTSPVGYLEGLYVEENYRRKGIAKMLVKNCENWAKASNCLEFASDCELDNKLSQEFHKHLGFEEANRIVCYKKKI